MALLLSLSGCGWLNRKLIYVPQRGMPATPQRLGLAFEDLTLDSGGGRKPERVNAWYVPASSTAPVVLLCHGNGGNMAHRLEKLRLLRKAGAGVMLFDYRGYGLSTGKPSERGTYEDSEAAYAWLRSRGISDSRIVVHGESLGAGVAVELATRHPVGGLIVENGFTSTLDMGRRLFRWLPVSLLVKYRYDNLAKISRVKAPILVIHSRQDEIIPFEMGQRLFDAAASPKTFVEIQGGHNDGFFVSAQAYTDALRAFLGSL
jgi:uncharacterized protein